MSENEMDSESERDRDECLRELEREAIEREKALEAKVAALEDRLASRDEALRHYEEVVCLDSREALRGGAQVPAVSPEKVGAVLRERDELRDRVASLERERDEARALNAYVADRINEEVRQASSHPHVEDYARMQSFKAALRGIGDRLVHVQIERDALRAEVEQLRKEAKR